MLEQVQRERVTAVEQVGVALLDGQQIAAADLLDQVEQVRALARR